jgi:aromatic-L-amino-acid/L-tryptophan decarboxylase
MERPLPVTDLNWNADQAREIAGAALDIWAELLERLPEQPPGRTEPQREVAAAMGWPVPDEPMRLGEMTGLLRSLVFDHSTHPGHGGFFAYISGAGTIPGAAADLLAAGLNPNSGGWSLSPAASELELHLMRWLAGRFGLPEGSSGLMTTGGAMSNLTALKAARDAKATGHVREHGVAGERMAFYVSEEAHATNVEAADMLGLGEQAVRAIPTDERFAMRIDELERAIERDVAAGIRPAAVVGTAGTTATGTVDPLDEIADVCARHDAWFHVDAAYGGAAILAPDIAPRLEGIGRADSIGFDPHKWLNTPQSSACLLVRDPGRLVASFDIDAAYVRDDPELSGIGTNIGSTGPAWSRSFMALKVWMSLAAHGLDAYARRISHDTALARYLAGEANRRPELEQVGPVELSIACFRYVPPDLPDDEHREAYLNHLNERLMAALRADGRSFPSNAVLRGRYVLRACVMSFRTEADDIDRLLDAASEVGERLDRSLRPAALAR